MTLITPTQQLFSDAQEAIQSILSLFAPLLSSKKASVVYLLLVRPYAYVYAKINALISSYVYKSSVAYLKTSTETSNSTADLVASNYFVTRTVGIKASGSLLIISTTPYVRFNTYSNISINGTLFKPKKLTVVTLRDMLDTDTVDYIKPQSYGEKYRFLLPIEAILTGYKEIPAGVDVSMDQIPTGVESMQLLSPITGGGDALTDSLMMERCLRFGNVISGTQSAILNHLQTSGIDIISAHSLGGQLSSCFRARYNNLAVPMAGIVDTYVKTANQLTTSIITATTDSDSGVQCCLLNSANYPDIAGLISVGSIFADTTQITDYTCKFISDTNDMDALSARLSTHQAVLLKFSDLTSATLLTITVNHTANLYNLQMYADENKLIGQDILLKAAIPVSLKLTCQAECTLTPTDLLVYSFKTLLSKIINNLPVGTTMLNMNDVDKALDQSFSTISLKLPYYIEVAVPTQIGGLYTYNTTNGTVDLNFRRGYYYWLPTQCFFFISPDDITLELV